MDKEELEKALEKERSRLTAEFTRDHNELLESLIRFLEASKI